MRIFCLLLLTGCPAIWERPIDPTDPDTDTDTDTDTGFLIEPFVTVYGVEFRRGLVRLRVSVGDPQGLDDLVSLSVSGSPDVERVDFAIIAPEMVLDIPWTALCSPIDGRVELEIRDRSGNSGFDVMPVRRPHDEVDGLFNFLTSVPFSACGTALQGLTDCFSISIDRPVQVDVVADGRVTVQEGGEVINERVGTGRLEVRPSAPGFVQFCVASRPGDRPAWAMEAR